MDRMSQELKGNPPENLSDTTLEQLTTLGNIIKLKSVVMYECGLPTLHLLPTPPLFIQPTVNPLTPPRVPTGKEIPSPSPRVKPSRILPADVVQEERIDLPQRVEPPQHSARIAELVSLEEEYTFQDNGLAHRTRIQTRTVAQESMFV